MFKKYKLILNSNNLPSKKYVLRGITKTQVLNVFSELSIEEKNVNNSHSVGG